MKFLLASLYPFSPEVLYAESVIFGAMQDTEHELYVLKTGDNPKVLPGLSMLGLESTKNFPQNLLENIEMFETDLSICLPKVKTLMIDDFICESEIECIKKWVDQIIVDDSLNNSLAIQFEGIDVGKHACFNTLRQFKLDRVDNLSSDILVRYKINLEASAICVTIAKNLSKIFTFDAVSLSHYNYCASKSFFHTLEKFSGTRIFATTTPNVMGMSVSHSLIGWCQKSSWTNELFNVWKTCKESPRDDFLKMSEHYINMFIGNSRTDYTSAVSENEIDIYKNWGFSKKKKIVMIAMSSADEMFAVTKSGEELGMRIIFENQIEWLSHLIPVLRTREDYQFIIRVHPRDMYNGVASEHLKEILAICGELPSHIVLNVPSDEISSHEIMKYCSLLLTSWSTTSIEMGLFGIPTLSITKHHDTLPQDEMGKQVSTIQGYFSRLTELLSQETLFDEKYIRYSFRWSFFYYNMVHLDISDILNYKKNIMTRQEDERLRSIPNQKYNPIYLTYRYPINESEIIQRSMIDNSEPYQYKMKSLKYIDFSSETLAIKEVLKKFLCTIFGLPCDKKIIYVSVLPEVLSDECYYLTGSKFVQHRSNLRYIEEHEILLKNIANFAMNRS